jgi:hypothetical protein
VKLVSACPAGRAHYAWCGHFVACVSAVGRGLGWWRNAGSEEEFFVYGDEEAFAAGEDRAVWVLDFGLMEELTAGCAISFRGAVEMEADEDERLVERDGAKIVDLHMAGHGEDVEGAIELAHGFVE